MKFLWIRMSLSWLYMQLLQERRPAEKLVRPLVRIELERLEDRLAPAAFTVDTPKDNGNDKNPIQDTPNTGSLRAAIIAVNAGKFDTINFNIKGAKDGLQVVYVVGNPLPGITKPVTIDGSTAPGKSVEIHPSDEKGAQGNGLTFAAGADGSQVLGLVIDGFKSNGLTGGNGIFLNAVSNILIGAKRDPKTNELIFGTMAMYDNDLAGIEIFGGKATKNKIYDCILGISDSSETGNEYGAYIAGGANLNTIGGILTSQRNIISGNKSCGVKIQVVSYLYCTAGQLNHSSIGHI